MPDTMYAEAAEEEMDRVDQTHADTEASKEDFRQEVEDTLRQASSQPVTLDFTKIKFNGTKLWLWWEEGDKETKKKYALADPHPDFQKALQDLREWLGHMLELPEDYYHDMEVRGITITYEDGLRSYTITGLKDLGRERIATFNTPHATAPPDCDRAVDDLFEEAEQYLNGKRMTGDLFED